MAQPYSEDRDEARFDHISHLQVEDLGTGKTYEARMQNFSNGGIYFESDGLFEKGTQIYISVKNSPYAQSSGVLEYYTGEVMWRKYLKRSFFNYGYGIQFVSGSIRQDMESNNPNINESRRRPRKPFFRKIRFGTKKGVYAGSTKNISAFGAFIATDDKLEVGQSLRLNLPFKGKTVKILGKIVWLNEEGFGIKFQKIK